MSESQCHREHEACPAPVAVSGSPYGIQNVAGIPSQDPIKGYADLLHSLKNPLTYRKSPKPSMPSVE